MNPLLTESASQLALRIRSGQSSAVEVVECHIERIEAVNPRLVAVVRGRFETARQEAKEADALLGRADTPEPPPLLGVPCTIKESIALAGMPNSAGVVARADVVAREDATVVARLRKAGAIPLGVTNTSEMTAHPGAYNRIYGRTCNAYDALHSPGGSSGGEGAIIGAGGSPFGVGTDVGGSIRMPAFCNGVFGHKPTGGLVPGTGQFPVYTGPWLRFNTTGPLARRAEDLMPLLRVLAGPDGEDAGCLDWPLGDPAGVNLERVRVVVPQEEIRGAPVNAELRRARENAAYALAARGARVEMRSLPELRRANDLSLGLVLEAGGLDFGSLVGGGAGTLLRELWRCARGTSPHTTPILVTALAQELGLRLSPRFQRHADRARRLGAELDELLGDDGVLLYPSARGFAPPVRGDLRAIANIFYMGLFNTLEMPVTQVPLGLGEAGLPLGVQVAGARGRDHLTIAVALTLEDAFGGWIPPGWVPPGATR